MIHECKVQCHTLDIKTAEDLGIEDKGKWLPFIFHMDIVNAAKLASDEEDSTAYNCTSIFTTNGDTFIIDTPFKDFFKKFTEWNTLQFIIRDDGNDSIPPLEEDDLDL